MPLTLAELPPDALAGIGVHLSPRSFARLLRCSRRLHSWGEVWAQTSVLELDLRHMTQLTDGTLEKAARRYPAVTGALHFPLPIHFFSMRLVLVYPLCCICRAPARLLHAVRARAVDRSSLGRLARPTVGLYGTAHRSPAGATQRPSNVR